MTTNTALVSAAVSIALSAISVGTASAQTLPQPALGHQWGVSHMHQMHKQQPGIFGTVTAISGTTITVESKGLRNGSQAAGTTYTVDASTATIEKSGSTSSLSSISVGDSIAIRGAVSGTSVSATAIMDGFGGRAFNKGTQPQMQQLPIQGNGQPVVGGKVTAIAGSVLTLTTKAGTMFTVDATSASVVKGGASSALSSVALGDNVLVQGTINGSSVSATSVIDQGAQGSGAPAAPGARNRGFLGAIGGFLQSMFGFF